MNVHTSITPTAAESAGPRIEQRKKQQSQSTPPPITTKTAPKSRKRATAAAKPNDFDAIRNALPFFRLSRGKVETSWWNVTPSDNYSADLETGKAYARAFLPMMAFNAGASTLGVIVSHMALAGRDPAKNTSKHRAIDNVALGFLMEIGNSISAAIGSLALATVAMKKPKSDLGANFVKAVDRGSVLAMLKMQSRSTLYHDPGATIFTEPKIDAFAAEQRP
jgi:hypothetical protein